MKSLDAIFTSGGTTRLATALKITRKKLVSAGPVDDGIYAFTTHSAAHVIDGVTYLNGLNVLDISISADASVGNLELAALKDSEVFTTADLMNGRWRNAEFLIFRYSIDHVEINSPPATAIDPLLAGNVGEITILDNIIVAELLDLRLYLQTPVGDASSQLCRRRLGSTGQIGGNCKVRLNPPTWQALTPYTVRPVGDASLGSVVKPSPLNDRHFRCTTAGTSGATQPIWNTTIGGTTADGSVVWTTFYALTVEGSITDKTSNQIFQDSTLDAPADFFGDGFFIIDSGDNAGASFAVKEYAADGTITLKTPVYGELDVGTLFTMEAGCRKRHEEDCWDKFDNGLNFVAEPHRKGLNNITGAPSTDVSSIQAALEETF